MSHYSFQRSKAKVVFNAIMLPFIDLRYSRKSCYVSAATAEGRTCDRVSCSYGSAIYLCNGNAVAINPPCSVVADFALSVKNTCRQYYSYKGGLTDYQTGGLVSFKTTTQVIFYSLLTLGVRIGIYG